MQKLFAKCVTTSIFAVVVIVMYFFLDREFEFQAGEGI